MIVNSGIYSFNLSCNFADVRSTVDFLYGDARCDKSIHDFYVAIKASSPLRRYFRAQASFYNNQFSPFKPLPRSQAYALLEWGMNWCIANFDHNRLLIHSAVLVKDNQAILFPALPGSGKSTLSAYFSLSGWELYSDEMAIIDIRSHKVLPVYRPICLKNNSINLVKSWFPAAKLTATWPDTLKGDIAHVKVLDWKQYSSFEPANIVGIAFPKFINDKQTTIYNLTQVQGFESLSKNAFNYTVLGQTGFDVLYSIISKASLFEIQYSDLADVQSFLEDSIIQ